MKIVFLSLTGNVRNFVGRLEYESIEIDYSNQCFDVNEEYILIVPSYDDEITDIISQFIDHNRNIEYLLGFVGSGNRNFDNSFCFNARDLSKKYNKPLIYTFEFSGTDDDLTEFRKGVNNIEVT